MQILAPALVAVATLAPLVVSAQDFLAYEGKNAVREGEGGTKRTVEGIDFWADGSPPRPFKLLGYITDRRHKTGLIGKVRMSTLESDIAKVAKENGGDAVILVNSETETVGSVGSTFGTSAGTADTRQGHTTMSTSGGSTGVAKAVQKEQSKYAVVKYVEPSNSTDGTRKAGAP